MTGLSEFSLTAYQQVFRTPLHHFDVLIHLNKSHAPLSGLGVDARPSPSPHRPSSLLKPSHLPVVDFDPAMLFVRELEVKFLCEGLRKIFSIFFRKYFLFSVSVK